MALIGVSKAALIGFVVLFGVNLVDSNNCYKCTSADDGEDCGIELKSDTHCTMDGDYLSCMTYQFKINDSTVTVRDCPHDDYNCKTLYADGKNDSLVMCNECNNDVDCNENIVTNNTCVKCDSSLDQNCGDTIEEVGDTCFLDSTVNTECVVYKYKQDSATVTVRGCGRDNTCDTLRSGDYKDNLEMCDECTNTNGTNCNQNIAPSKTCIKCNSLDQPGCENATIDTSIITGTCDWDDTINTECITYKYENDNKIVTVRDCASKDTCKSFLSDTYKETLVMCHECSSDTPNCNQNLDGLPTCVECNSSQDSNCSETKIDTSTTTGVCYLDKIVNFECITYQYLEKDSSIVSVRGCAQDKKCASLYSETYKNNLLMCDECNNTSNCNQEFDTTKTCIECNSEDDPDCQDSSPDLNTTCFLDQTVKTQCITYKINNENNETVTIKGCAPPKQCSNLLSTEKSSLLMCDMCTNADDNNCNREIDQTETCIECNSETDPDCENDKIDPGSPNATFCYLDQTVKNQCVIYKYQKDDKTQVTIRGCAAKDYCETLRDNSLIMCNHCTGNNCNSEIHNSKKCVQCNSINDPKCADDKIDTKVVSDTCDLDDTVNVQCVSYRYFQDGQHFVYKGCGSENYCANAWSNTTACTSCTDSDDNEMCNSDVKFDEDKILCIQCTSEDDEECKKEDMNSSKIKNYCPLDENNSECVAYEYLNPLDGTFEINRGCVPTDYCNILNDYANTTACNEGTKFISNKKIDTSNEEILCVQCTGGEGSNCAAEEVDLTQINFCKTPNKGVNSCFAHKYLNSSTGKMITERGCDDPGYCQQQDTNYTAICSECQDQICNKKIDATSEKAFCIECDGEEGTACGTEKITDLGQVRFCVLSSTEDSKCVAHRYLNTTSGQIHTYRGCASEDYCESSESTRISCTTCKENDKYCNKDIDEKDEKTLCVQCDSETDGSKCSVNTVDLSNIGFCGIDSKEDRQCVAHKYLNVTTNKFSTYRGCETKNYCAQYNTSSTTILCNECKDGNNCNMAIDPDNVTLCVKCNSDDGSECTTDEISDLTKFQFCKLNSANEKCVAYKYLDVTSGKIKTYRGCEAEHYCNKQNDSTKVICSECDNDNSCNMKIEADEEKTLCVSCEGEACASNSVDLKQVGFCGLTSSDTKQCVSRRYVEVRSGKIKTYRGCAAENYCAKYNYSDTSILCNECRNGDLCNEIIENEDALCVECTGEEGSECGADTITDFNQVNFCKIKSSDKSQCVAHRYLDVTSGKISTYRGCENDNYCDHLSTDSQMAMICTKCSSTDTVCNTKIDTSQEQILCINCTGEEGTDCANNTINDLTKVQFCTLTDNQQCVTHKYLIDDKTNKINIKRSCEKTNYCDKYKNGANTLMCDECHDEICNAASKNEEKFICAQCNSEQESECANNTVSSAEVHACIINSTANQECVSHKYLNVSTGKINTYRGCGSRDYCEQQNSADNGSTALCIECNDSDHCNMNIDASEELTLCVECVGEEGSDCAAATVDLTKMSFCGISPENAENKTCISYRYIEKSIKRLITVRGCETRNCSTLVVDYGKVQQCSVCHGDICNNYLEIIPPTTTLPPTTTSGAASIIQYKFNVLFLYLIIGLLFLVD